MAYSGGLAQVSSAISEAGLCEISGSKLLTFEIAEKYREGTR